MNIQSAENSSPRNFGELRVSALSFEQTEVTAETPRTLRKRSEHRS
jgi:hypothetical protein